MHVCMHVVCACVYVCVGVCARSCVCKAYLYVSKLMYVHIIIRVIDNFFRLGVLNVSLSLTLGAHACSEGYSSCPMCVCS